MPDTIIPQPDDSDITAAPLACASASEPPDPNALPDTRAGWQARAVRITVLAEDWADRAKAAEAERMAALRAIGELALLWAEDQERIAASEQYARVAEERMRIAEAKYDAEHADWLALDAKLSASEQRVAVLREALEGIGRKLEVGRLGLTMHGPQWTRITEARDMARAAWAGSMGEGE